MLVYFMQSVFKGACFVNPQCMTSPAKDFVNKKPGTHPCKLISPFCRFALTWPSHDIWSVCFDQAVNFWTSNLMFSWSSINTLQTLRWSLGNLPSSWKLKLSNSISVTTHLKLKNSLLCLWAHEPNSKRKLCSVYFVCMPTFILFWLPVHLFPCFLLAVNLSARNLLKCMFLV